MRITKFAFYHTKYKLEDISIATIYGNGKTNGVLPSFLEGELVNEFESWELHDDDLSSLVLSSVHLLAVTTFI